MALKIGLEYLTPKNSLQFKDFANHRKLPPSQTVVKRRGFRSLSTLSPLVTPLPRVCITHQTYPKYLHLRTRFQSRRKFVVCAKDVKNGDKNEVNKDPDLDKGDGGENQRPAFFNLRWTELLLDPDPDNVLAVGLTGLLTWASVQVVWQLLAVSLAIVVAALKYSFVAALLIFILVALL